MTRTHSPLEFVLVALLSASWSSIDTHAFIISSSFLPLPSNNPFLLPSSARSFKKSSQLNGGIGVADTYSWNEEQFEIEVKVSVPAGTSAKDVRFKCSSESIDLRLLNRVTDDDGEGRERVLLDGSRRTRGKICVDGTFWSIEGNPHKEREITIAIEKLFVPVSSEGGTQTFDTLTDFDWGGIYPNDEEEVSHRKYDQAEELNVREYAAKLGVDIDNIDMSKVNKTMFGAGLGGSAESAVSGSDNSEGEGNEGGGNDSNEGFHFNITQAALNQLTKSGLAKEVLRQGDGTEYELGSDGSLDEKRKFSMLGREISNDELREAGIVSGGADVPRSFVEQSVPVEEAPGYRETFNAGNFLGDGIVEDEIMENEIVSENDSVKIAEEVGKVEMANEVEEVRTERNLEAELANEDSHKKSDGLVGKDSSSDKKSTDPIDMLTVARLKEILKAQGLKVSGTKQILRDRLRAHVNALLQEE
eukprot:CAMPEP_0172568452 /NCGR_PEP_ID=MMETSP1067-20121228/120029_1 /TAXON_ID=265564 ORGANISM="Thalassiosira punctigera, Strain Tpunct2005C2" /NCGR_SAMPLE_ID=MMETSP1067 /ASSEMBLY_ACC=CAM_ASM_000444 /LENGTH=473 /DNA_ID=CAMNT_0013360059 /DNA_START=178 /DNA_END=1599 /DNA_ORIENTATION=+